MALYTKKKEVDLCVKDLLSKLKTENERKLKGFNIARLYHQVGEHTTARQYLSWYLQARPNAAAAHKLLGQIQQALNEPVAALEAYEKSLQLDPRQRDLVLIGSKLVLELPAGSCDVSVWLERAEKYFPVDPIVQRLREHCFSSAVNGDGSKQLEEMLADSIAAHPLDVDSHIRLVELQCKSGALQKAYSYVSQVEQRAVFPSSLTWYQTLVNTCQIFHDLLTDDRCEFYITYLSGLDRLIQLSLQNRSPTADVTKNLLKFDQLLFRATREVSDGDGAPAQDQTQLEWRAFTSHMTGQLYFHTGSVLLCMVRQDSSDSKEATDMALATFLACQSFQPLDTASRLYQLSARQTVLDQWRRRAACRLVQTGWSFLAADQRGKINQLSVIQQFCSQQGREKIYKRVFAPSETLRSGRPSNSAFLTLPGYLEPAWSMPRSQQLMALAGLYWAEHGSSLQHAVWLRQHSAAPPAGLLPELQPATANCGTAAPETLCRLDILAFLEATVYTTDRIQAMHRSKHDLDNISPPDVAGHLCSQEQARWWEAVHKLYTDTSPAVSLSEVRRTLQYGLEVIRCLGNHSNSVQLVIRLADWCAEQARSDAGCEMYQTRCELYLRAAISQLERLKNGVPRSSVERPLFPSLEPNPEPAETERMLDEVSVRLAARLRARGQLDEALDYARGFRSAESSFELGLTLRALAEQNEGSLARDYLRRAKEAFYLTLDRRRDPAAADSRPGLDRELSDQIREVEALLLEEIMSFNRFVDDTVGRGDLNATPDRTYHSAVDQSGYRSRPMAHGAALTSTPCRSAPGERLRPSAETNGTPAHPSLSVSALQEARPSPERLDAEVRSLASAQDGIMKLLLELRDQQEQQWRQREDQLRSRLLPELRDSLLNQLRDSLLNELREPLLQKLRENQQVAEELRAELEDLRRQQRPQSAPSGVPGPGAIPPVSSTLPQQSYQMNLHLAALAGMRGMPLMPVSFPSPLQYLAGAYQGLSLQDLEAGAGVPPPFTGPLPGAAGPGGLGGPAVQQPPAISPVLTPSPAAPPTSVARPPNFSFRPPPSSAPATGTLSKPTEVTAPANVTVCTKETLPPPGSALTAPVPPSVVIPPEHRKQPVAPSLPQPSVTFSNLPKPVSTPTTPGTHKFQIALPPGAKLQTTSPITDPDKPAYTTVSTLPTIPAPEYSAVTPPSTGIRGHGRERLDSTGSFHEDPDYDPMSDFKPVVPLPEEVEVRTGEEGDTCLFEARTKLFRFVDTEWKERGVGQLKILYRQDDGRVRIVMRREQIHKVCANHYIQPEMELSQMVNQPRAFVWAAKDFADEELKDERLCARFKTEEIAAEFKVAFEKAKEIIRTGSSKPAPTLPEQPKPAVAKPAFTFSGAAGSVPTVVSSLGEEDTAGESDEYETEEETTDDGEGTEDEEPERIACKPEFKFSGQAAGAGAAAPFSFGFTGAPATSTATSGQTGFRFGDPAPKATPTFGFGFGTSSAGSAAVTSTSVADTGFKFGETGGAAKPAASGAPAPAAASSVFQFSVLPAGTTSAAAGASAFSFSTGGKVDLGGFSFTSTPTLKKTDDTPEPAVQTQEKAKPSPFGGFSFGDPSKTGQASSLFDNGKSLFGDKAAVDFASIAKSGTTFKKDESFTGFPDSGRPVFGDGSSKGQDDHDDSGPHAEEYEPTVDFQPVVPLPALVDQKTGEEGEEKLFGQRAKLYRMDETTKEWKERGVGEMKILKNTSTGRTRILMRREQVLKLCANHAISSEMKLTPLASSDKAWVWSATDFSEGEANRETLAVKFKNIDVAQSFKDVFEKCQREMAEAGTARPDTGTTASVPPAATSSSDVTSPATPVTSAPATVTPSATPADCGRGHVSFVFGAGGAEAGTSAFRFSGVKPKSPVKPRSRDASLNESSGAGEDNELYEGDEGEHLMFEPVIPLPDKVEVVTGEEDETELFCSRSKLFRFDKTTSEWKERGLGILKLLEHKQTKKIRLLMRREQVLKICLNHRLTPQLRFQMKDEKSVTWAAQDFADGEAKDEVFTARFKTPETAGQFVVALHKAQEKLGGTPAKVAAASPPAPKPSQSVSEKSLDGVSICTPEKSAHGSKDTFTFRLSTPTIYGNGSGGGSNSTSIFGWSTSPTSNPFSGRPPAGGSVFGSPSGATPAATSGFSFGSRFSGSSAEEAPAAASFTFRLPASSSEAPAAAASDEDDDVQIVGELTASAEQQAAAARLQLPPGFYLYTQRPGCPGCRGCRDQMPDETPAADSSHAKPELEPAASPSQSGRRPSSGVTFTTNTAHVPTTGAKTGAPFTYPSGLAPSAGPAATSAWSKHTTNADPAAAASSAPSAGITFKFTDSTAGPAAAQLRGNRDSASPAGSGGVTSSSSCSSVSSGASQPTPTPAPFTFGFAGAQTAAPAGPVTGSVFGSSPAQKVDPSAAAGQSAAPFKFAFGGGQAATLSSASSKVTFNFGAASGPVFGGAAGQKSEATPTSANSDSTAADKPTFGFGLQTSGPVLDFGSLAKSGPTFAKKDPDFKFSGAGAAVFGSPQKDANDAGSDGEEAHGGDDSTHDPHFEPVVPLPELVEIKTGEEDEEKMFSCRAVLYRFDRDTSQWKERGRGDIKLLKNNTTGNYRVLMRREQVHKLACNHRVSADMSLSRMGTNDKAWVWSAMDYADEEPKAETLAVRFKSEQLAEEFRTAFEAAVEATRQRAAEPADQSAGADQEPAAEEEGEEDSLMFVRHATLQVLRGSEWMTLGEGNLRVLYDDEVYSVKIIMLKDVCGQVLCDHLITMQHKYEVDGADVQWSALDYACDPPLRRRFRARLESAEYALELALAMDQGVEIAVGSEICDTVEADSSVGRGSDDDE